MSDGEEDAHSNELAKRHIFRTPTREPPMPTAAQRAAMRGGPARDTESVATSRSHAEVVEIPVPKVIPPRAWSPSPAFTPLSQSLRPWSGSLFQPLLVPAASGFGYGVPEADTRHQLLLDEYGLVPQLQPKGTGKVPAPPPVTRMASTSWLPKRNQPASTVLGREPMPSIERDFDGAGVSHSAPENLPGPSVEALKLELKRRLAEGRGLDFVFCFSKEDLYRRLREETGLGRDDRRLCTGSGREEAEKFPALETGTDDAEESASSADDSDGEQVGSLALRLGREDPIAIELVLRVASGGGPSAPSSH
eukprot:s8_g41.t1